MGIRVDRSGKLTKDPRYFEHSGNDSWEVKIRDLPGGKFLRIGDLSDEERRILENGLREANLSLRIPRSGRIAKHKLREGVRQKLPSKRKLPS